MNIDDMTPEQIETEARKQGWKPESEWKGEPPPRGFVDADEFLAAGDKSLPLVTKERDELKERLEKTESKLSKMSQQVSRFTDFTNKALNKARQERDAALNELRRQKAQAISDNDGDTVLEVEEKIAQLEREPLDDPAPPPEVEEWATENEWYEKDPDMRDLANGISLRLREERPDLSGPAHLDELTRRVRKAMPHKFENPKRETGDGVEGGRRQPVSRKKTWDDLPPDAKQAYEDTRELMATLGREYKKEQYLASYEWDD